MLACCSTSLCTHLLVLVRVLAGDQTRNLGASGPRSNPLSHLARALKLSHKCFYVTEHNKIAIGSDFLFNSLSPLSVLWGPLSAVGVPPSLTSDPCSPWPRASLTAGDRQGGALNCCAGCLSQGFSFSSVRCVGV